MRSVHSIYLAQIFDFTIKAGFFLFVLFLPILFFGQTPDRSYDEEMLDFWIGDWEVSWFNEDSVLLLGENRVHKILNDKVVKENFVIETGPQKGFIGKSWSVFNPRTSEWNQTWVDNQGAYLEFTGELRGDSVIFRRQFMLDSSSLREQRMVFYNIQSESFQWVWQHRDRRIKESVSEQWIDDWLINYQRKDQ